MLFSRDADTFLFSHGVHPEQVDMDLLCSRFLAEMNEGLQGAPSSLSMLPSFISVDEEIPADEPVIVFDAGGTNFRACLVEFDGEKNPRISGFVKHPMPGSRGKVSRDEFFARMAEYARPLLDASGTIGFCFSYPTESTPERDGRLLHFSKEMQAPEVVGELIGKNLTEKLQEVNPGGSWKISILNDTSATLLAGKLASGRQYSGYIGFILGTGTNTSYIESSQQIGKVPSESFTGKNQIINVESGGFAVDLSDLDADFYKTTAHPDTYHFEKIISGAYLGPYILFVLKQAARDKLFSDDTCTAIQEIASLTTIEMDDLLHTPDKPSVLHDACGGDVKDCFLVSQIADRLVERAGRLSAVNLSAAVLKTDAGKDPEHPVCINADGTTFLKTHAMKEYTVGYLDEFLVEQHQRFYDMIHVDNSPVLGAAIAGLLNQ